MSKMNITNESVATEIIKSIDGFLFVRNSILLLFGIAAFIGSSLIIFVILKYPALRQKEDAIYIIGFLAVTDGTTGLGSIIIALNWLRLQIFQITTYTIAECVHVFVVIFIGVYSSQVMIAWIAVDRLIAIASPIKYMGMDHYKFAFRTFFFTILFALISAVAVIFCVDPNKKPLVCIASAKVYKAYTRYFSAFGFIIAIIVILIYIAMLIVLKRKKTPMALLNGDGPSAAQLQRQARATRIITMILGLYCVLWIAPNWLFTFLSMIGASKNFLANVGPFISVGSAASAASNIFVYGYKMPSFRFYIKKLFKLQKDNQVNPQNIGQHHKIQVRPPKESPNVEMLHPDAGVAGNYEMKGS